MAQTPDIIFEQGFIPLKVTYFNHGVPAIYNKSIIKICPEVLISQILYEFRCKITSKNKALRDPNTTITAEEGLYIIIPKFNIIPMPNFTLKNIYDKYKAEDKFLYLEIHKDSIFGEPTTTPLLKHAILSSEDPARFWCSFLYGWISEISLIQYIFGKCASTT